MTEIAPGLSLVVADCLDALRELDAGSVDAICTDPPYGLEFMGKDWDRLDGDGWRTGGGFSKPGIGDRPTAWTSFGQGDTANATCATCGGRMRGARKCACDQPDWRVKGKPLPESGADSRQAQGRKMQEWHHRWAVEALRVLKPGGHALVFGGTRTYHRLASGLEDAGFEIRDCLAWMYGSGFPKSLDVAKAIDKAKGVEGGYGEPRTPAHADWIARGSRMRGTEGDPGWQRPWMDDVEAVDRAAREYLPGSDEGRAWQGWGTALKPAFEPIVVARKPLIGTVAGNVLAHGVGGLNVDACRIGFSSDADQVAAFPGGRVTSHGSGSLAGPRDAQEVERAEVEAAQSALGRWPANVLLGHSPDCVPVGTREVASDGHYPAARPGGVEIGTVGHAGQDDLEVWDCVHDCPVRLLDEQTGDNGGASRFFYVAKVSRAERNAGLDDFDAQFAPTMGNGIGGKEDPETATPKRNVHPTVKPVALMRWLIRLVTPPGGLVLDTFAGSGSTGCAAALEGARFLGVERDPDYAKIAEARIRFWAEHGDEALRVVAGREASERAREAVAASGQLDLLGGGE